MCDAIFSWNNWPPIPSIATAFIQLWTANCPSSWSPPINGSVSPVWHEHPTPNLSQVPFQRRSRICSRKEQRCQGEWTLFEWDQSSWKGTFLSSYRGCPPESGKGMSPAIHLWSRTGSPHQPCFRSLWRNYWLTPHVSHDWIFTF